MTKEMVMGGSVRPGTAFFSWLEITSHHNFGLLGNLPLPPFAILALSLLAMGLLSYGLYQALKQSRCFDFISLSLVLGAALGNFYDRLRFGYVFDWLMLFRTSIVNLSDLLIGLGLVLYIARQLFPDQKPEAHVDCQDGRTKLDHKKHA